MATLAELKTRVIAETARDDMGPGGELEQSLADAIAGAIQHHSADQFWFNRAFGTIFTVASGAALALPAGMRICQRVARTGMLLDKVALEEIFGLQDRGAPLWWAEYASGWIYLNPVPDGAYTLTVQGLAELGVPGAGASNAWTNEGVDLIAARARMILYRDSLRDPEGAEMARAAAKEALDALRAETARRVRTSLKNDLPRLSSRLPIGAA